MPTNPEMANSLNYSAQCLEAVSAMLDLFGPHVGLQLDNNVKEKLAALSHRFDDGQGGSTWSGCVPAFGAYETWVSVHSYIIPALAEIVNYIRAVEAQLSGGHAPRKV